MNRHGYFYVKSVRYTRKNFYGGYVFKISTLIIFQNSLCKTTFPPGETTSLQKTEGKSSIINFFFRSEKIVNSFLIFPVVIWTLNSPKMLCKFYSQRFLRSWSRQRREKWEKCVFSLWGSVQRPHVARGGRGGAHPLLRKSWCFFLHRHQCIVFRY